MKPKITEIEGGWEIHEFPLEVPEDDNGCHAIAKLEKYSFENCPGFTREIFRFAEKDVNLCRHCFGVNFPDHPKAVELGVNKGKSDLIKKIFNMIPADW